MTRKSFTTNWSQKRGGKNRKKKICFLFAFHLCLVRISILTFWVNAYTVCKLWVNINLSCHHVQGLNNQNCKNREKQFLLFPTVMLICEQKNPCRKKGTCANYWHRYACIECKRAVIFINPYGIYGPLKWLKRLKLMLSNEVIIHMLYLWESWLGFACSGLRLIAIPHKNLKEIPSCIHILQGNTSKGLEKDTTLWDTRYKRMVSLFSHHTILQARQAYIKKWRPSLLWFFSLLQHLLISLAAAKDKQRLEMPATGFQTKRKLGLVLILHYIWWVWFFMQSRYSLVFKTLINFRWRGFSWL